MEKGKKNRKQVIIGISVLLLVTLLLLGLTYAYYRTRIVGNSNSESISVTSKNLEVTYQDNDPQVITEKGISPGYTKEKKFSVENTGNGEASYSIKLDNLENSFVRFSDWTYKLYKGEEKDTPIAEGIIGHGEEQTIKSYETVSSPGTNTYTLEIEYENSTTEDQSMDMGATLSLRVNIGNSIGDELRNAPQGTLLHAIGENNPNIISPVTIPGKEASGIVGNVGVIGSAKYDMKLVLSWSSYLNDYLTYGTGYEYNSETGKYELTGVQTGVYSQIYTQLPGKYLGSSIPYNVFNYSDSNGLDEVCQVVSADLEKITYKTSTKDFKEAELSYTEDDYGTSYYYRGAVDNNYVTFANMCWRIVRVQGDGSIKITLYDEQNPCDQSEERDNGAFISEEGKGQAVLSSYYKNLGPSTNKADLKFGTSTVESTLRDWYGFPDINLSAYEKDIEIEAEWCNDLSEEPPVKDKFYFGAYKRLSSENSTGPSLKCKSLNDENDESIYMGKIGLLSVDEVAFAGGFVKGISSDYYLYSQAVNMYFTLSPAYFTNTYYTIYYVNHSTAYDIGLGFLVDLLDDAKSYIRPALVLVSGVTVAPDGDGTKSNPYVITNS